MTWGMTDLGRIRITRSEAAMVFACLLACVFVILVMKYFTHASLRLKTGRNRIGWM